MPKCLLCFAGYFALGGAAVELCGGVPADDSAAWPVGAMLGAVVFSLGRRNLKPSGHGGH